MLARKIAQKIFSLFQIFFSFFKQIIKKWGGRFLKNLPSQFFFFFLCLYFIGVGGDENLKKLFGMASFDTIKIHVGQCNLHTSKGH